MAQQPDFAADTAGIVSVVGWGDPRNVSVTGTTSVDVTTSQRAIETAA